MTPSFFQAKLFRKSCPNFSLIKENIECFEISGAVKRVLMGGSEANSLAPNEQIERWEKLSVNTEVISLLVNYVNFLEELKTHSRVEFEKALVYENIQKGCYGDSAKKFFTSNNDNFSKPKETILYYYVLYRDAVNKQDYFEMVLRDIFDDKLTVYYDRHKMKVFVAFKDYFSKENEDIALVCKTFFANRFPETEFFWRCAPYVIDRTKYTICDENSHQCYTII